MQERTSIYNNYACFYPVVRETVAIFIIIGWPSRIFIKANSATLTIIIRSMLCNICLINWSIHVKPMSMISSKENQCVFVFTIFLYKIIINKNTLLIFFFFFCFLNLKTFIKLCMHYLEPFYCFFNCNFHFYQFGKCAREIQSMQLIEYAVIKERWGNNV